MRAWSFTGYPSSFAHEASVLVSRTARTGRQVVMDQPRHP
jgi:hypothetical protein